MIKVLTNDSNSVLAPELSVSWIDLSTKELKVAENTKDNVTTIGLEVIAASRKTPIQLLVLATIMIAAEVSEKYKDDDLLEPTIKTFVNEKLSGTIEQCDRYVKSAMENTKVIDFTSIRQVNIAVNERVERDADDAPISASVVAKIEGEVVDYVYSNAGVFDKFEPQPEPEPAIATFTPSVPAEDTPEPEREEEKSEDSDGKEE